MSETQRVSGACICIYYQSYISDCQFSYFAAGPKDKQTYQVWQHDNHPIELYSAGVIEQKMDYLHLNPVRAGYVEKSQDWLYSSAPFYAVTRDGPIISDYTPLIDIVPVWQWFYEEGPGST